MVSRTKLEMAGNAEPMLEQKFGTKDAALGDAALAVNVVEAEGQDAGPQQDGQVRLDPVHDNTSFSKYFLQYTEYAENSKRGGAGAGRKAAPRERLETTDIPLGGGVKQQGKEGDRHTYHYINIPDVSRRKDRGGRPVRFMWRRGDLRLYRAQQGREETDPLRAVAGVMAF